MPRHAGSGELVYGRNPVRELIRAGRRAIDEIRATDAVAGESWLQEAGAPVRRSSKDALANLAKTGDHQGVVAVAGRYPYVSLRAVAEAPGPLLCLDGAHDPRNIGAVARVVEAVGGAGLVLPARGASGITPVVCKASAGAVEHLRVARVESVVGALGELRDVGRMVVGADSSGGVDYRGLHVSDGWVLVLGVEGEGLRPKVRQACDALTHIPMRGSVDSLNLSVAAGVLLFGLSLSPPG